VPQRLDMVLVWPKLASYIGVGEDERARMETMLNNLRASDGSRKTQQILLKEDVSRDVAATLRTHEAELPGVDVVSIAVRVPVRRGGRAHARLHGRGRRGEALAVLQASGYVEGDRIGITGVERAWESYLRGTRGWEKVLVDARGRRRQGGEQIIEEPRKVDPIPGRDLRVTIDARHRARRWRRPSAASSPAASCWSTCARAASSACIRSRASIPTRSPAAPASR
jgi:penicillin-binding protein 2